MTSLDAFWISASMALAACTPPPDPARSEAERYLDEASYRRDVLERDLLSTDNDYAEQRLEHYALADGWDALPERDLASIALTFAEAERLRDGSTPSFDPSIATTLLPDVLPQTDEEWIELGRRVWFEYPFVRSPTLDATARAGQLQQLGVAAWDDQWVGVRVFEDDGRIGLGPTCALCHASVGAQGPTAISSNRSLQLGGMRLLALASGEDGMVDEIDTSTVAQLELLRPGHSDPLDDGRFTPYAFPDLGGIAQLPYLHHTANWRNTSTTTLAIRVETVYITATAQRSRIPRALSWAVAMYLRSLPPPAPLTTLDEVEHATGLAVFESAGCARCHQPPLYTSDRLVTVEEIGTDPDAGRSRARGTGYYRIPSLRGVGRAAPYLHDGAIPSLEELLDPLRAEPGHRHGLELRDADRDALLAFLRGI